VLIYCEIDRFFKKISILFELADFDLNLSPYFFDKGDGVRQIKTREWWIVDVSDGTPKNHRRLTSFNVPGSQEYRDYGQGELIITAECSFSPDDSKISGIVGKRALDGSSNTLSVGLIEFK